MKERILVILHDSKEDRVPLNKERMILGRDKDSDYVLNGTEFSRQHIAIHFKFDAVYIENISSGGELKVGNKPTEYAELREGTEAVVGNYSIKWTFGEIEKVEFPNTSQHSQSGVKAFSDGASVSQIRNSDENTNPSGDALSGDSLPQLENTLQASDGADLIMSDEMVEAFSEDETVTQHGASVGMLRILSGEIIGREIKLEHGKEWIVGRAKECHISIDNPKISRHHFRIVQMAGGFRVQDLDSSYGIKVNGVNVKDAPLKSFDSISAGPVELQFLVADKSMSAMPESLANAGAGLAPVVLPSLLREGNGAGGAPQNGQMRSESTNVPAVRANQNQGGQAFQFTPQGAPTGASSSKDTSQKKKLLPKERIKIWFLKYKKQPKSRQVLIGLLPLLILIGIIATLVPNEPRPVPVRAAKTPPKKSDKSADNVNPAETSEVSAEFNLKSPKEQAEIRLLYAQAEEARGKGEWQRAHDLAQDIIRRVNNYKRTKEIISEAQGYLTDLQIATLTQAENDTDTVALANKQKVDELLLEGSTALGEKRWDDAQEIYAKALLLDPKNDMATRGQLASQAKDASALNRKTALEREPAQQKSESSVSSVAPPPDAASFEAINQDYQGAKQKIQEGAFKDAYPVLKNLKKKIESLIADDENSRGPALAAIAEDKRNLRSKIIESLDLINDQFVLEYKTQLDDAQQAIANQKFVEARAIYDTIINREALFEEPKKERDKLYKKMITDGQSAYREGLVSESVGDLTTALELYEKAKSYFENVDRKEAQEYYAILDKKLRTLKK